MEKIIEYRVRTIQRYLITRYERNEDGSAGSESLGQFDNWYKAIETAERLVAGEPGAVFLTDNMKSVSTSCDEEAQRACVACYTGNGVCEVSKS